MVVHLFITHIESYRLHVRYRCMICAYLCYDHTQQINAELREVNRVVSKFCKFYPEMTLI